MSADTVFPFTLLASIVRTRGLRGELVCELLTDFPEKFAERKRLFLLSSIDVEAGRADRAREVKLEDSWMPTGKSAGRIVLKLAGCDSIEDAEKLLKMLVAIPREERAKLAEDEFFTSDLEGCEIVTSEGPLGRVASVDTATTGTALLVVKDAAGAEILVPWVKAYLVHVDIPAKRIEMALPPGLVDVNKSEPKLQAKLAHKRKRKADSSLRSE
jgi:16S rRNA processing protein RimM